MASLARIQIIGNVGRDPELRMTQNGLPVCEFSVAVNRVTSQGGERAEQTDWYRVTCWGKQAETAQRIVTKGRLVFVDGRFQPRTFTGRDGQERWSFDVSANDFQLLDPRRDREGGMGGGDVPQPKGQEQEPGGFDPDKVDPDEIPF